MSRHQQNFISTFMDLTGCCKEEATLYAKKFSNMDDAINRYYDNPLPFTRPKPAAPVASVSSSYSKAFIDEYEKHKNEAGDLCEDGLVEFFEKLGIPDNGKYYYYLFYISNATSLKVFKKTDIIKICETVPFTGNYKNDIDDYFEKNIKNKCYGTFMRKIYNGLLAMIRQINRENNISDPRNPNQLQKSQIERVENAIYFVDLIEDVFCELYDDDFIKGNPCFMLFVQYIIEGRKVLLISFDDFHYLDYFLHKFKKVEDLIYTEEKLDAEICSLSGLGEDFLRYHNKLPTGN